MNPYSPQTPEKVGDALAERLKAIRLAKSWRQVTLAERAGVSLASLRRFEESGQVSLKNLLRLAFALGHLDDFDDLFQEHQPNNLAELEARVTRPKRKRGRI